MDDIDQLTAVILAIFTLLDAMVASSDQDHRRELAAQVEGRLLDLVRCTRGEVTEEIVERLLVRSALH